MTERPSTTDARKRERHRADRGGWLRAAVLGADDGVVSTSSLMIGVAASTASVQAILVAGAAGAVAGALSMAAGEYVSVSSQRDAEEADIALEKKELASDPEGELEELAGIYRRRGLDHDLAHRVAVQLSKRGQRLVTHLRDELGMDPNALARPLQAAVVSALSFGTFAALPIGVVLVAPESIRLQAIAVVSLVCLAVLGAIGGWLGGAPMIRASIRVTIGGGVAMAVTAFIGRLMGHAYG